MITKQSGKGGNAKAKARKADAWDMKHGRTRRGTLPNKNKGSKDGQQYQPIPTRPGGYRYYTNYRVGK